ncbi:MAG TPA: hypothetical protein DEA96_07185 [Leptospiraceae bacterium]|nr:hypothetical protein [Spirochaetaceae bacterium]HBS04729.1 hypothetical protein [Leptospiraceae bacterium]
MIESQLKIVRGCRSVIRSKPSFRAIVLISLITVFFSAVDVKANGAGMFRRAYSLETSDPEAAIQSYRAALSQGLPANLRRAAVWKVYFLYKRNHYYIQAYRYGNSIGAGGSHQSEILRNALHRWGITSSDFETLVKAWSSPSSFPDTANRIIASRSRKAPVLAADLRRALELEGKGDMASRIIVRKPNSKTGNDPDLEQAEYYYSQGDLNGAEALLWKKSRSDDINSSARSRLLYLLGKIRSKQDRESEAIRFYRLAAGYATDSESRRMLALASYQLYRNGKKDAAYELIDQFPEPDEDRMRLYFLVVAVDAADNQNALRKLRSMEKEIRERVRLGQAGFLEKKALTLLK